MSSIQYKRLPSSLSVDREYVSIQLYALLIFLEPYLPADFNVNEGHRTWARQQQLVAEKGVWSPSNPYGAALPSNNAPHILTGHFNHALDCRNLQALIDAAARHTSVRFFRTVSTEEWHGQETNEGRLGRWYGAYIKRLRTRVERAALARRKSKRAVLRATRQLKKRKAREAEARRKLKGARP